MLRRAAVVLALVACSGKDSPAPQRYDGGPPPRRVVGAPPRHVRALPPYAIGAEGVGPYKLGVPMGQILASLPSGPRMALLQIPGVLDYTVARDEGLLVGGERQGLSQFIGIVRRDIARTGEDGVGVGAAAAALEAALGPEQVEPAVARDPALWVGSKLPGARFVMAGGRVSGVLLTAAPASSAAAAAPSTPAAATGDAGVVVPPSPRCERAAGDNDFAGVAPGVTFQPACLAGADGVGVSGDTVLVASRGSRGVPARRLAALEIRGLVWAAPIETERGRDEIVAVAETAGADGRAYAVIGLRLEGTKLVRVVDEVAYRLDETRATWIGASLPDLQLRLEVSADGDSLIVGGVLVHRSVNSVRELAPLLPVTMRRRARGGEVDKGRTDPLNGLNVPVDAGTESGVDAEHPDGPTAPPP